MRIGIVTAIDSTTHRASVYFDDTGTVSTDVFILQRSNSLFLPPVGAVVVVATLDGEDADSIIMGVVA